MKKLIVFSAVIVIVFAFAMCHKATEFNETGYDDRLTGGGLATVFDATSKAFTHAVDGLGERDAKVHSLGDKAFEQTFVSSPAPIFGGLGPIFNNVSCISCHHNDGKGTPSFGTATSSMLIRLSLTGTDEHGGPIAVPNFGLQLQDQALFGVPCEAHVRLSYNDMVVNYPDGSTATLHKPDYQFTDFYTPIQGSFMFSPRMAPPVFGGGLLENISEQTILSFVDQNDKNGDGISGKANYVYNPYTKQTELGRFGLKANTSSILVQVATAYQQDMGVTSFVQPQKSCYGQSQYVKTDGYDLPDSTLKAVTYYVQTLAVPARRDVNDPDNKAGELIFNQINCSGCHRQTMVTGVNNTIKQVSNQRIHPYTDLLLHDMGDDLADNRPDFLASGHEWRTMPLWGIGLFEKTNGIPYYLHDGRARTIEEAILWHGGEAKKSRDAFMQLSKSDRDKLIKFLKSL